MEERIIDDEYGRGIRLKKTADGYVDATDELVEEENDEQETDEVAFEFPVFGDEDDEDLVVRSRAGSCEQIWCVESIWLPEYA